MTARFHRLFSVCLFALLGAIASAQITEVPPDDPPGEIPDLPIPDGPPALPNFISYLKHPVGDGETLKLSFFHPVESGETGTWIKSTDFVNWTEMEPPAERDGPWVELHYTVAPGETIFISWRKDEAP